MGKPTNDCALEILWFAIGLQVLFLAGTYFKIPFLTSPPVFIAQLLSPAAVVVVASTWRRALKFSFLSSLILPATVSLLLVLLAIISFILKPGMSRFLMRVGMSIDTSLTVWAVVLKISLPSIIVGVAIRFGWSKLRPNSRA